MNDYLHQQAVLKIIVVGESGVGKTAICRYFVDGRFTEQYKATIGADLLSKTVDVAEYKNVLLQMWDTAGQERFQSMQPQFWRGANAAILVYDITSTESFDALNKYKDDLITQIGLDEFNTFPVLLLGNKSDLSEEQRQVQAFDARNYGQQFEWLFYETSAKNGNNIEDAIKDLAKAAIKLYKFEIPNLEPASQGDPDLWNDDMQELDNFQPQPNYCGGCVLL